MQPEIDELSGTLSEFMLQSSSLKVFDLYEEFSKNSIEKAIKECSMEYRFDNQKGDELLKDRIHDFYKWLKEIKGFTKEIAHYYSVSVKGILAGIPSGLEMALLFNVIIEKLENREHPT